MKYLSALLVVAVLTSARADEVELLYPSRVRVGDEFKLVVKARSQPGKNIVYEFNGETRVAPPDMLYYPAVEYKAANAKVVDGVRITSVSKYQTLCTVPFPQNQGETAVWLRYSKGPLCLRRPDKELRWSWKATAQPQWIYVGRYDAETVGPVLSVMGSPKEPYAHVEAILLTTADARVFRPSANPTNVFSWRPGRSAIGRHELSLKVDGNDHAVIFEVVDDDTTPPAALLIPAARQVSLARRDLGQNPEAFPLFHLFNDHYRRLLAENPLGLRFDDSFLLPLKCNEYPRLSDTVIIDVHTKVAGLAFLLSEYWQGEVNQEMAHFMVRYDDGSDVKIPLREEVEICGSLRNRSPQGALFVGMANSPSIEYNLTVVPWRNPHPEKTIETLTFTNVRTVFNEEENKLIPLNVTSVSSQILLSLVGLSDAGDVAALVAAAATPSSLAGTVADITMDFKRVGGRIHPGVFSTNESGVMTASEVDFDRYLETMKEIGCRIFRFHSGWNLEKVYPTQLDHPNYEPLVRTIQKLYAANSEWEVMICFNRIPKYLDPKTAAGRTLFATLCADLVRELNIARKLEVTYWEIYNEVYFTKIEDDRALWHMYNEAAAAMRAVDPSIRIGGYAPCWPVLSNIRDFYEHCHPNTDFVSYHKYLTGSVTTSTDYIMRQTPSFAADARQIRALIEEISPGKAVELALTEYNINYNWKPHDPRQGTYIGAAWLASVLNHLIRADVEIAQTWHSRGGGTFGLISAEGEIRPMGKLLAVCNSFVRGDYVWSRSSSTDIECLGFRNGEQAGFLVINKSSRATQLTLSLLNPPDFQVSEVIPAARCFAFTEAGFSVTRQPFPKDLELAPYETRVIVNPLSSTP